MIVLDASALVELLLDTPIGRAVATRIADPTLGLHVPDLADVEVAQALRRYVKDGDLDAAEAAIALEDREPWICRGMRMSHQLIAGRSWESSEAPLAIVWGGVRKLWLLGIRDKHPALAQLSRHDTFPLHSPFIVDNGSTTMASSSSDAIGIGMKADAWLRSRSTKVWHGSRR